MDIYVWWSLFEDCGRGIHNNIGGYQAFQNVFLRSKECDLSTQSQGWLSNSLPNGLCAVAATGACACRCWWVSKRPPGCSKLRLATR